MRARDGADARRKQQAHAHAPTLRHVRGHMYTQKRIGLPALAEKHCRCAGTSPWSRRSGYRRHRVSRRSCSSRSTQPSTVCTRSHRMVLHRWAGLGWGGLGWAGVGWGGLGWAGPGWAGPGWVCEGVCTRHVAAVDVAYAREALHCEWNECAECRNRQANKQTNKPARTNDEGSFGSSKEACHGRVRTAKEARCGSTCIEAPGVDLSLRHAVACGHIYRPVEPAVE
jgi:hypothetical protein